MTESFRKFEPITDPKTRADLFREAAQNFASVVVWTKGQERIIKTAIHMVSETSGEIYAIEPEDFDHAEFIEELGKSGSRDCYFSVSLARKNLFFQAKFLGFDGGLKFQTPEQVFKVLRRAQIRIHWPDTAKPKIEIQDPLFPDKILTLKARDISSGGAGIEVSDAHSALFVEGLILDAVSFTLGFRGVKCRAKVCHSSPLRSEGSIVGHHVGLQFMDLSIADRQSIMAFVLEETRKKVSI